MNTVNLPHCHARFKQKLAFREIHELEINGLRPSEFVPPSTKALCVALDQLLVAAHHSAAAAPQKRLEHPQSAVRPHGCHLDAHELHQCHLEASGFGLINARAAIGSLETGHD